jgi:cytochrome bd ubiquinol oxidase subunit I
MPVLYRTPSLQPVSGDLLAQRVATYQPAKLAAFEAHYHTQGGSPFHLVGHPDSTTQTVPYSLAIPYGLSVLVHHDPDHFPRDQWPPVPVVHAAFQVMVGRAASCLYEATWRAVSQTRRP